MKNLKLTGFALLIICFASCNTDDEIIHGEVEFIAEYSATVTVGGIIGIIERTFEIGEVYKATDDGGKTITIRIAEHSDLNEDCPNSWCYQEFLDVPREYLRFVK
ncbi:hypothetical protein [Marinilabilia salmonicolor]|uniref:hypothetical protein n=1 Tax=Marinilabilia salmonicolor TaxID=989 RepID=UPI00029A4F5D|nr:hypothetical protein [Marinilabilia salmonicolor]